ncbi:cysteine desulfurase [Candidatus Parcubacteria bacterium]|nr:cysteine desulfurase [Candidatus Parcubacteria bacterium]
MPKRIYLDHASATPLDAGVGKAMEPYFAKEFGNPSAIYKEGLMAKRALEGARKGIANVLKCRAEEIYFTNGATESLNLAISGAVQAWKAKNKGVPEVIVSAIEHEAVLGAVRALEQWGVKVIYVKPNKEGMISVRDVEKHFNKNTALVSVMYANNEIGTIQPIKEIGRAIKLWKLKQKSDVYPLFHTDACQAGNYLPLDVNSLGVQLLTLNAAKLYGPKGIAILYMKRNTPLAPLLHGGGQERGFRPGTENVPLIVGMAASLVKAQNLKDKESKRLILVRDYFIKGLLALGDIELNGSAKNRLPNNVNVRIEGIDNEFFVIELDAAGVAASTKSACKEGSDEASHVILAIGKSAREANESVRLTLGRSTTKKEIDYTLHTIKKLLANNEYQNAVRSQKL